MSFDLRNFSQILAERQGGIRLKPGRSYVFELTESEVLEIFGSIPVAVATSYVTVRVREFKPKNYRIMIKLESTT